MSSPGEKMQKNMELKGFSPKTQPHTSRVSSNMPDISRIKHFRKKAEADVKITRIVTPHTPRDCFGTHLLESGANLYYIQHLLGHSNPISTNVYLHLTPSTFPKSQSPLDRLAGINYG